MHQLGPVDPASTPIQRPGHAQPVHGRAHWRRVAAAVAVSQLAPRPCRRPAWPCRRSRVRPPAARPRVRPLAQHAQAPQRLLHAQPSAQPNAVSQHPSGRVAGPTARRWPCRGLGSALSRDTMPCLASSCHNTLHLSHDTLGVL